MSKCIWKNLSRDLCHITAVRRSEESLVTKTEAEQVMQRVEVVNLWLVHEFLFSKGLEIYLYKCIYISVYMFLKLYLLAVHALRFWLVITLQPNVEDGGLYA